MTQLVCDSSHLPEVVIIYFSHTVPAGVPVLLIPSAFSSTSEANWLRYQHILCGSDVFSPVSGMKEDDTGAWSQGSTNIRATVGLLGHLHSGMINLGGSFHKSGILSCKHPKKILAGLMNTPDKRSKNLNLKI